MHGTPLYLFWEGWFENTIIASMDNPRTRLSAVQSGNPPQYPPLGARPEISPTRAGDSRKGTVLESAALEHRRGSKAGHSEMWIYRGTTWCLETL